MVICFLGIIYFKCVVFVFFVFIFYIILTCLLNKTKWVSGTIVVMVVDFVQTTSILICNLISVKLFGEANNQKPPQLHISSFSQSSSNRKLSNTKSIKYSTFTFLLIMYLFNRAYLIDCYAEFHYGSYP